MAGRTKITTFRGKRGTWVTTKTGRRIFIEEKYIKAYQKWTNDEKVSEKDHRGWCRYSIGGALRWRTLSESVQTRISKIWRSCFWRKAGYAGSHCSGFSYWDQFAGKT